MDSKEKKDSGGRICVPIMYYTNETGEIIYDEEGMAECLKNEIKTIADLSVVSNAIANAIDSLNDIDGETMQFILEKVGMEEQMLRQLMMTMPLEQVEYLMEERMYLIRINQQNQ